VRKCATFSAGIAFSVAIEHSGADPAAGAAPLLTTVRRRE
jgi:hypothetical protein